MNIWLKYTRRGRIKFFCSFFLSIKVVAKQGYRFRYRWRGRDFLWVFIIYFFWTSIRCFQLSIHLHSGLFTQQTNIQIIQNWCLEYLTFNSCMFAIVGLSLVPWQTKILRSCRFLALATLIMIIVIIITIEKITKKCFC